MEYDERLSVPLRWWVQATMLVASLWLAVVVAMPALAATVITLIAAALVAGGLVAYGAARIRVRDGVIHAGRAHIAVEHLGAITPLDKEASRHLAGPGANARAFLLLRPYLKRSVKIEIADPADPTPYWQLGTRHPDRLAKALLAAVPQAGDASPA